MHAVWNILDPDLYTPDGQAYMEELYGSVLLARSALGIRGFKQLYTNINESSREWNRIADHLIQEAQRP